MCYLDNQVKRIIIEKYDSFTPVEKKIADFFKSNIAKNDFSARTISKQLYVSEAALSRFAQKCGYKGYREMIFNYSAGLDIEKREKDIGLLSAGVKNVYQDLLDRNFELLDEEKMRHIAFMLNGSKHVSVYGMGSSGLAAKEMQLRFMRLGMMIEAVTDSQMIKMNAALLNEESTVIAVSLSGKTQEILAGIRIAKEHGAKVIFITSDTGAISEEKCDEVIKVASAKNLEEGRMISPQFPLLVMIDILFSYYFANDTFLKEKTHKMTLAALKESAGEKEKANESI